MCRTRHDRDPERSDDGLDKCVKRRTRYHCVACYVAQCRRTVLDSCREDRRVRCGEMEKALYLVFAIVACVLQAVRSSRAAQTVGDLVQRTAQMEEQRNEINVNFQVADDSQTHHDGKKPSQQHCRRLEASWNTVVGKLRVPVVMSSCRCEHRVGYTGARAWDCGGACRTTTDAVAQRQSWTGVQLDHPCPHWWAITVTSILPPTDLDRALAAILAQSGTTMQERMFQCVNACQGADVASSFLVVALFWSETLHTEGGVGVENSLVTLQGAFFLTSCLVCRTRHDRDFGSNMNAQIFVKKP